MLPIRRIHTAAVAIWLSSLIPPAVAQTAPPASNATAEDQDIVVVARKARAVMIKFRVDDKTRAVKCRVTKSSGDKEFDAFMCEPPRRCAGVNPFNKDTFGACLERARSEVLREYLASHPRK